MKSFYSFLIVTLLATQFAHADPTVSGGASSQHKTISPPKDGSDAAPAFRAAIASNTYLVVAPVT
jgi:hypothetical protein